VRTGVALVECRLSDGDALREHTQQGAGHAYGTGLPVCKLLRLLRRWEDPIGEDGRTFRSVSAASGRAAQLKLADCRGPVNPPVAFYRVWGDNPSANVGAGLGSWSFKRWTDQ